jgi:ferritin
MVSNNLETAQNIIDALKLIGDNGMGIYMMDKELGMRTYSPLSNAK